MNTTKGTPGNTRIDHGNGDTWIVEAVDNNGVWVLAEPGTRYATQDEAEEVAEAIAANHGGQFVGVCGSLAEIAARK